MLYCPLAVEEDGQGRHKTVFQVGWSNNSRWHDCGEIAEIVVHADTEGTVHSYIVTDAIPGVVGTLGGAVIRHVVRQLTLEKVSGAALASPHHLVLQVMLRRQAVHDYVISFHHEAIVGRICTGLDKTGCIVIRTPEPEVVADDIT
jgi:hypothetical protein